MANIIKAQIAPVSIGHLTIEGLFGDDGVFYLLTHQVFQRFSITASSAIKLLKDKFGENYEFCQHESKDGHMRDIISVPDFISLTSVLNRDKHKGAQYFRDIVLGTYEPEIDDQTKLTDSSIYVFQTEDQKFIKVGISSDPKSRLKEVQTGCPMPIRLLMMSKPRKDAKKLESKIHKALKRYKTSGEWFTSEALTDNR